MRFVLDCSVAMAFFFEDEKSDYTEDVLSLFTCGGCAIVPPLFYLEVVNVLCVAEKRGRCDAVKSMEFIRLLRGMNFESDGTYDKNQIVLFETCREFGLTAYDVSYLLTAIRNDVPLATQDKQLIRAAKVKGVYLERGM